MTDPERIAKRRGFAAQLLQAGGAEQPDPAGVERTLAALGLTGVILSSSAAVSAAAVGTKLTSAVSGGSAALSAGTASAGASGALSAVLVAKWIGIGMIGGVSFAGAASVMTRPTTPPVAAVSVAPRVAVAPRASSATVTEAARVVEASPSAEPSPAAPAAVARPSVVEPPAVAPENDLGVPLSAEVEFVDRGRALLRAGRTLEGLSLLEGYERAFSEARLLPEVLFLQLEACDRLGRTAEARHLAERLVRGFPKSPHAARARKLLER